MIGLKWRNIDFDNQLIHIISTVLYTPKEGIFEDTTKTQDSVRTIKLSAHIFHLLMEHQQQQEDIKDKLGNQWIDKDFVFTQWNGEAMHPNTPYT